MPNPEFRIGEGNDRHRLESDETLIIGGVELEAEKGSVGHSDGDVLLHSIMNSILGAAALDDIGEHFPDDEPTWEDAASLDLLDRVISDVTGVGWTICNVDSTVFLERIRLKSYRSEIEETISRHLHGDAVVNVKFNTGEGLGPVGRGNAIEARSIALIRRS